jgi:hypothetical protein
MSKKHHPFTRYRMGILMVFSKHGPPPKTPTLWYYNSFTCSSPSLSINWDFYSYAMYPMQLQFLLIFLSKVHLKSDNVPLLVQLPPLFKLPSTYLFLDLITFTFLSVSLVSTFFFFLSLLGFELNALYLLGRHSTTEHCFILGPVWSVILLFMLPQ